MEIDCASSSPAKNWWTGKKKRDEKWKRGKLSTILQDTSRKIDRSFRKLRNEETIKMMSLPGSQIGIEQ